VDDALNILKYTKKEAAVWLDKLLLSAIANWEDKAGAGLDADEYDLYVKTIFADQGTMLKRFRPAPQGRAHRIRKHNCHVTIVVENRVPLDEYYDEEEEEYEEYEEATEE
jgi:large subunit ribosomal protein L22